MKIDIRNVNQTFGETTALEDFSLELEGDKIIGLLGRNGSGKSTLLNIMAAFRKPTSGEVMIDGEPVFENESAMQRITLIRETGDTVEDSEKVSEALRFAEYLRPNWSGDRALELLEKFEISTSSKIEELSRGRRSGLGIALGLAANTELTMLDETYLGLDAPSRCIFYDELLNEFMERPRMFIISSHLIEEVARVLEEIVIIDKGKVLMHETHEALSSRGAAVTGHEDDVNAFVSGREVIGERQLGRTKSAMIYGDINGDFRARAQAANLDIEALGIQDLFVHLTSKKGGA